MYNVFGSMLFSGSSYVAAPDGSRTPVSLPRTKLRAVRKSSDHDNNLPCRHRKKGTDVYSLETRDT